MTLTEFLLARIADDEAEAADMLASWDGDLGDPDATPFVQWGNRVLAECEAKRRIVEWCGFITTCATHRAPVISCRECEAAEMASGYDERVLEFLALPYADHPDYRPEWRPYPLWWGKP